MTRTRVRTRVVFACTKCGAQAPKWLGRCVECGAWSTLVEETFNDPSSAVLRVAGAPEDQPIPLAQVDPNAGAGRPSGVVELDRVLGGGFVRGSVTLLAGEPGIGKSTLALQALGRMAESGYRCLLVSAEESKEQVRLRADRVDALASNLLVVSETSLPNVLAHIDDVVPDVLVIDSIQTIVDPELPGGAGSVAQVRECAQSFARVAKKTGLIVILVGHVTKDGSIAGPRSLEHLVDTVLAFEGDRHHALRMLYPLKHRYGSTNELGVFEMRDGGLEDVPDPSALFLADRRAELTGSIVTPILEGGRPLLVEVQALVVPTQGDAPPRRTTQGIDSGRLALLQAVLDRKGDIRIGFADVYASVAGGVRVVDPGIDLALTLALASAHMGCSLPPDFVAVGEIGLGGEVRLASQHPRRLAEAARLGFRHAIVPMSAPAVEGIESIPVRAIAEALSITGMYN